MKYKNLKITILASITVFVSIFSVILLSVQEENSENLVESEIKDPWGCYKKRGTELVDGDMIMKKKDLCLEEVAYEDNNYEACLYLFNQESCLVSVSISTNTYLCDKADNLNDEKNCLEFLVRNVWDDTSTSIYDPNWREWNNLDEIYSKETLSVNVGESLPYFAGVVNEDGKIYVNKTSYIDGEAVSSPVEYECLDEDGSQRTRKNSYGEDPYLHILNSCNFSDGQMFIVIEKVEFK